MSDDVPSKPAVDLAKGRSEDSPEMVTYAWHREMTKALRDHEGVLIKRIERVEPAAREAVEAFLKYDYPSCSSELGAAMVRLKEALPDA